MVLQLHTHTHTSLLLLICLVRSVATYGVICQNEWEWLSAAYFRMTSMTSFQNMDLNGVIKRLE